MRHIDVFTHFFPEAFFERMLQTPAGSRDLGKRMRAIPAVHNLQARLRAIECFDDYSQIICLGLPPVEVLFGPEESPELARIGNDGMAEIVAKHPRHFAGYVASLPMNVPEAAAREAERVLAAGAAGLQLYTNVNGAPLDEPCFLPVFEIAAKSGRPILLHPARTPDVPDYRTEAASKYEIWNILGWPYETSAAMARLVFSGVMDRVPGLKIIAHHLGAMMPFFVGRIGVGWDHLGARTSGEDLDAVAKRLTKRPVDYFRDFYGDTAVCGARSPIVCGLDFYGADHVLFATDAPFDGEGGTLWTRQTMDALATIELSPQDREKVCHRNAERMFGLAGGSARPSD